MRSVKLNSAPHTKRSFHSLAYTPRNPNHVYIDPKRSPAIFTRLNRSFPPPSYIVGKQEDLSMFLQPSEIKEVLSYQQDVIVREDIKLQQVQDSIKSELEKAGVEVRPLATVSKGEVPAMYYGQYEGFKFTRGWRYWCVDGNVPMELAEKIYTDPIGNKVIRTEGYAGNADPKKFEKITGYHIDTQEGLNRFIDLVSRA